jgi:predicted PurR-regulated permease PerM
MRARRKNADRSRWPAATLGLGSVVLVVGVLYWARQILIPVALAILLTFILAPIVAGLRRRGLGRTSSVIVTVVLAFVLLGGTGTVIFIEFRSLANELPAYRQNILKKISEVRIASKGGAIEKIQGTVKDIMDEINKEETAAANDSEAVPVVITGGQPVQQAGAAIVGPLLEPISSAGLVIVLVIFMLLRREDLRDRLLRLAGYGRLAATTKAIDEAGKQMSKYLLRQFLVNAGYGVGIGAGLSLIGLPYAILWGFLAAVTRFIPYVGPWLGALGPIVMSLAVFDGWTTPVLVLCLVTGLELINSMLIEPVLYGESIGISEVALLIMMAFWTWLWGTTGLVLAAPLTVCLMVISKSVPDLEGLDVLLGSAPAMDAHHVFYQRLVAKDGDEARGIVETFLKTHSHTELFEQLFIPTLISCRNDHELDRLDDEDREFILRAVRQFVEEAESSVVRKTIVATEGAGLAKERQSSPRPQNLILGCPANDEADELALLMLAELLSAKDWHMRILSPEMLSSESIAEIETSAPALVCIGFLPGGPVFPVRQFCKKLRSRFPKLPVLVGQWSSREREKTQHQISALATAISWTLDETLNHVVHFGQLCPVGGTVQHKRPGLSQREDDRSTPNEFLVVSEQL